MKRQITAKVVGMLEESLDSQVLSDTSNDLEEIEQRDELFGKSHQKWSPPVVVGGPCDAMRLGIGMTITIPGYPMSVTRHYFNHEYLYNFIRVVVYSFASFQLIECDVYV